jgi:hypothetical protein
MKLAGLVRSKPLNMLETISTVRGFHGVEGAKPLMMLTTGKQPKGIQIK